MKHLCVSKAQRGIYAQLQGTESLSEKPRTRDATFSTTPRRNRARSVTRAHGYHPGNMQPDIELKARSPEKGTTSPSNLSLTVLPKDYSSLEVQTDLESQVEELLSGPSPPHPHPHFSGRAPWLRAGAPYWLPAGTNLLPLLLLRLRPLCRIMLLRGPARQ